jgi:hypothetical protein
MYDAVIIGAGASGLFFAEEYLNLKQGNSIAIMDSGVSTIKRECPLVSHGKCNQCKPCSSVYGSGGAGMYSDGKLSSYPAGSGLLKHMLNEKNIMDLNRRVLDTILSRTTNYNVKQSSRESSAGSNLARKAGETDVCLKPYDVLHMGTEGIQKFCRAFESELERKGVEFLWRHKVYSISRTHQGFKIDCNHPQKGPITINT